MRAVLSRSVRPSALLPGGTLAAILALAGCVTMPEQRIVSHVDSLPPVATVVPVSCVKEMPELPKVVIDPNATVKQRYYQMRAALDELDRWYLESKILLQACIDSPKETK